MYAKKAFSPIPGARATGRFAAAPISIVAKAADTIVARIASSRGMPATDRSTGLTTAM